MAEPTDDDLSSDKQRRFREPASEEVLDDYGEALIFGLGGTLIIHETLLRHVLSGSSSPHYLAEYLEDVGNFYLDFSDLLIERLQVEKGSVSSAVSGVIY